MAAEVKTRLKTATVKLTEPENNPAAEYFFNLASQVVNRQTREELAAIGLTEERLRRLKESLKLLFGLEQEENETLYDFFHRVSAFFYYQLPETGKTITQGVVPANMDEMLRDLDQRKALIAQIKEKSQIDERLADYGLREEDEADRVINRLMEKRTREIETAFAAKTEIPPPEEVEKIAAVSLQEKPATKEILTTVRAPSPVKKELAAAVTGLAETNRYSTAVAAIAQKLTAPPPVIEGQLPKTVQNLPPETRARIAQKIAPILVGHAHQLTQDPETAPRVIAPLIAIVFEDEDITLPEEGRFLIPKLIIPVASAPETGPSPIEVVAREFSPEELVKQGKEEIKTIVASHFVKLGLDPNDKTTAPVIEVVAQDLATPPSLLAKSLASVAPPKEPTISETSASLPERPINLFHLILPDPKTNPLASLYAQSVVSQIPPSELNQRMSLWSSFGQHHPEMITQDPLLFYFDRLYRSEEGGVGYQVIRQPFYTLKSLGRPIVQPLINLGKKKIFQKLAQTALGKAVKKGAEKAAMAVAKKLALEVGKQVAVKGGGAAIAAALGIPTGGVSLVIWLVLEIGSRILSKLKTLFKKLSSLLDVVSFGLTTEIRNWIRENIGELPAKLFDLVKLPATFLGGLITASLGITVSSFLVPAFVIVFASLFFFNYQSNRYVATLRPPLGGKDFGMGITEEGLTTEIGPIMPFEADLSYCEDIDQPAAKLACFLTVIISDNNCLTINGAITDDNSSQIESCLLASEDLKQIISEDRIKQIAAALARSANDYKTLQCVGFKAAVEPNLPPLGDAYNYADTKKVSRYCNVVSSPDSPNLDGIRTGDNAVWGATRNCHSGDTCANNIACCGHIGIVIGLREINKEKRAIVSQAWGGSGIVNFREYTAASATYIRCH